MKIVLGCDHGGYAYKKELIAFLNEKGYETIDVGTDGGDTPASWSEFGVKAALKVQSGEADVGIVFCRSGQGVTIAANKVKGIYCGLVYNDKNAQLCKTHDGCNMIAFPADYCTIEEVKRRAILFLEAEFEGGRHLTRLNQLKNYENNNEI
jgi:ribose 5-phosphate isomerase B